MRQNAMTSMIRLQTASWKRMTIQSVADLLENHAGEAAWRAEHSAKPIT
jgi:hypothetical protein